MFSSAARVSCVFEEVFSGSLSSANDRGCAARSVPIGSLGGSLRWTTPRSLAAGRTALKSLILTIDARFGASRLTLKGPQRLRWAAAPPRTKEDKEVLMSSLLFFGAEAF